MAMIQCPNCGESISDKAKRCIHCAFELIPEEKIFCSECGAELEKGETVCHKCGCPVETTDIKAVKKNRKLLSIIVVVIVAIIAVFGIRVVQKQKAKQEYASNLELATFTMLSGASEAEACGNLIKQVWYNSIYEERNPSTDKYTRPNGRFVSDFNDALGNLFSDSTFINKIESIETNQSTVQSLMKDLKNPPEEYEDAYAALSEFYDAYMKLTNLVTNPTGSLRTFSSDFSDADTETYNGYSAMELYIE